MILGFSGIASTSKNFVSTRGKSGLLVSILFENNTLMTIHVLVTQELRSLETEFYIEQQRADVRRAANQGGHPLLCSERGSQVRTQSKMLASQSWFRPGGIF